MRRTVVVVGLGLAIAGCGAGIEQLTLRPDKYYQQTVTFRAEVSRTQALTGETLVELMDADGRRILMRTTEPFDAEPGSWVKVRGMLVPETRVADRVLYDVVVAERIRRARRPLLAGIW